MVHASHSDRCRVCGYGETRPHLTAAERMFGTGGSFTYAQCDDCRALQLIDVPSDLGAYYPPGYYSLRAAIAPEPAGRLREALLRRRLRGYFDGDWLGRALALIRPHPGLGALGRSKPAKDARILDIGCGRGDLLRLLRQGGFAALYGIDPFLQAPIAEPGLRIDNVAIEHYRADGLFDVVMMHHVLEHVADPVADLRRARQLLRSGGLCIVRLPVADSLAAERFGPFWVQLDAPRHLTIPTRRGMSRLAERAGLRVAGSYDDSTSFQFTGSDAYRQGKPLESITSRDCRSPVRRLWYGFRAWALNRINRGDQATFLLVAAQKP